MSLREWLVLIGIIVIAVVLIDGYRRMRLAKKRASELSFGLEEVKGEAADHFSSELPNGGARSRSLRSESSGNVSVADRASSHGRIEPGLAGMGFDEPVGTCEDVDITDDHSGSVGRARVFTRPAPEQGVSHANEGEHERVHQKTATADRGAAPRHPERAVGDMKTVEGTSWRKSTEPVGKDKPVTVMKKDKAREATEKLSDRPPAKEVVVMNVVAKGDQLFDGTKLLESVLSSGMKFGDMSIFHRYANDNGTGQILFSMANGVEPGIFSIDKIEETKTQAVSFFMGMPGPREPLKAFTKMVEAARQLALDLGGELKDEQFSVMTQQTIEHSRQRIIDYERKQLAHRMPG